MRVQHYSKAMSISDPKALIRIAREGGNDTIPEPLELGTRVRELRKAGELDPKIRARALAIVGVLWAGAIGVVLSFMIMSMTYAPADRPNPTQFTLNFGPWIIVATIILPALIAGWLASQKKQGNYLLEQDAPPSSGAGFAMDHLYRALVLDLH